MIENVEELKLCFKNSTEDANLKFERQTEEHSKLASEFEEAKLKQNADHKETLLKVDDASMQASNGVSSVSDQLERLVKKTESEIFERIATLNESLNKTDVSLKCLEAKQTKCDDLVSANRGLLNAMSDDIGCQLQELKEHEFNNGQDRKNIKEQIVKMQTSINLENNLTKLNIQVITFYRGIVSFIWLVKHKYRFAKIENLCNLKHN